MKMKKYIFSILFIISISFFLESCKKCEGLISPDPCAGVVSKFATDVLPLIKTSCATNSACHSTGSINNGGPLTNYSQIFSKRLDIKLQINSGSMPPPPSTLTSEQKNKIICWINAGAPDN
jgi:hypothetical protein